MGKIFPEPDGLPAFFQVIASVAVDRSPRTPWAILSLENRIILLGVGAVGESDSLGR
jgi:hypothetical protein